MSEASAYTQAGVDVDIEAEASRILYEASQQTYAHRAGLIGEIIEPFADFAALKMVAIDQLPEGSCMSLGFDTAGTKVELAQRVGKHDTIAFDLLAMVCDDALIRGGEPVLVGSTLDLKTLGSDDRFLPIVRELAQGYVAAAREANVAIINGEIAQLGSLMTGYGDFPYHWGAACIWFAKHDRLLTGMEIQVGDAVVVLRESGFRANGISLLRQVFERVHGENWHAYEYEGSTLGELALTPSVIYSRAVSSLWGGFAAEPVCAVHGVAHITGGGLPEKLKRVLHPSGLGARLSNLFAPSEIVRYCQEVGDISDADAYSAWNMGQGLAVITPEPERVIEYVADYGLEAQVAGEIVVDPTIELVSQGVQSSGTALQFGV